jgi:WD40-like Beta Propeller Repeat
MPRHPGRIAVRDGCGLGEKLAWNTKSNAILVSGVDAFNPITAPVPPGTNASPSLAPDGEGVAFLHSPRNDGKYDIWITSVTKPNAEQVTNTSNVSDVAWSPTGDWLGDAPDWSPDGKKLVYVHIGSIWTVNSDGCAAARSRRSLARLVARRRADHLHARREVREERLPRARLPRYADGSNPHEVGPAYSDERRLAWLPDPYE